MAQQLKKRLLNATRVLLVQQQIFVSKIHAEMTIGIIFVTIPYCIIYYLLHQEFLTVYAYP